MAFPTYQYPGYQPYYPQPVPDQLTQLRQQQMQAQMMQQPVPQQMQPQAQPQVPIPANPIAGNVQNNGINWVNGKAEADSWPIAPNCAVALWDNINPVIYLRQADSTGKPSTKVYDLVERIDSQPAQQHVPQIDMSRYITIEAAEEIIDRRVNDILAERLKRPQKANTKKEDTDNG